MKSSIATALWEQKWNLPVTFFLFRPKLSAVKISIMCSGLKEEKPPQNDLRCSIQEHLREAGGGLAVALGNVCDVTVCEPPTCLLPAFSSVLNYLTLPALRNIPKELER